MRYNWQQPDWPNFSYNLANIQDLLFKVSDRLGRSSGVLSALPESMQSDAIVNLMVTEAIKSSEIEGEFMSRQDVLSSIRNNLKLNVKPEVVRDGRARGIARLMVAVRDGYADPLTEESLFAWHAALMEGNSQVSKGMWRTHNEPMQVISGPLGQPKIHFEAPDSTAVPAEMSRFILWFNELALTKTGEIKHPAVRAAMVHLYFETIHPFEDGNGRIGRALAEKALAQGMGRPVLLSLSQAIESGKKRYYSALENAQRSNEITGWIEYFVQVVLQAQINADQLIDFVLQKVRFFDRFKGQLSDRQNKVLQRMLAEGPDGFEGGINARKYSSLTRVSKATTTRDLQHLEDIGALRRLGGGRSTRYEVNLT